MKFSLWLLAFCLPVMLMGQPATQKKKVLMVVSGYGKKEGKQRPGFEFDEFSQAWLIFRANGLEVDVASPRGGEVEPDGFNKVKPYNKQVMEDKVAMDKLRNTIPTAKLDAAVYDAIYIAGGKGAMFDLPFDPALQELILAISRKAGGVVSAVCHGPAVLTQVKGDDGKFLIDQKKITGFCNEEENTFGKKWKAEFPFLLEDKLKSRGAIYERSEPMLPQVSIDGNLVTGQNPYSTTMLAEEVVKLLGIKPVKRELYADEKSIMLVKRALRDEMAWAQQELKASHAQYDKELIAAWGYYQLTAAGTDQKKIRSSLDIIELVTPWVFNENLQYEMAKGYLQLGQKEKAKALLQQVINKKPSFEAAKKLMDELGE